MKNLLLLLAFLYASSVSAQWVQTNGPQESMALCLQRVGSEIWMGTYSGIYVSDNEGMSWHKSAVLHSLCSEIAVSGDTVMLLYQSPRSVVNGLPTANICSKVSFDRGLTWEDSTIINNQYNYQAATIAGFAKKSSPQILEMWDRYYRLDNWGLSWSQITSLPAPSEFFIRNEDNDTLLGGYNISNGRTAYFYSGDAAGSWHFIDSAQHINDMFLKDGILLGTVLDSTSTRSILRSANYGLTWDTVFKAPPGSNMYGFSTSDSIIFVNNSPVQYASNDNGLTWYVSSAPNPFSDLALQVDITGGNKLGRMAGIGVGIYVPARDSFYATSTGLAGAMPFILRSNRNTIFAGTDDILYRSVDAGATWIDCHLPYDGRVQDMVAKGDTLVAICFDVLARSWNNGVTWDTLHLPFYAHEIEMIGNTIYTADNGHYFSNDFGTTWAPYPILDSAIVAGCGNDNQSGSITAVDSLLFMATDDGTIAWYNAASRQWTGSGCFASGGAHNANVISVSGNDLILRGRLVLKVSHNQGLTWVDDLQNGLPDDSGSSNRKLIPASIKSINGLLVGYCGMYGPYVSTTGGNNWMPYYTGQIPFYSSNIMIFNGEIYAGAFFDGIWKRTGPLGNITGTVYNDLNDNGVRDTGEGPLVNQLLYTTPGNRMATTDTAGHYILITDAVGDTLRPALPVTFSNFHPGYYITSGNATNHDFGIHINPNVADLAIDLTNTTVFRSGFRTNLVLAARNNGSLAQVANVQLVLDTLLQVININPPPTAINGNRYTWITPLLQYSQVQNVLVQVQVPLILNSTDSVSILALVSPTANDILPLDNSAEIKLPVVGSFDPNDKTCTQGNLVTPEAVLNGEEIVFTIRFQNTGTYHADFVRIADTLSQYFDLSTFRVLAQSHAMHWAMTENGIVTFYFDSIMLPYELQDEPGSHGFVKYGIRCKPSVIKGNALVNTAYIYFDFNPAIITNTTTTLVAYPFNTEVPSGISVYNNEKVNVYPNPASDKLMVDTKELSGNGQRVTVFDLSGRVVYQQAIAKGLTTIDVSILNTGMYMGRLNNEQGKTIGNFKFAVSR